MVYLVCNLKIIPRGLAREKIRSEGRIKDASFYRFFSYEEVRDVIVKCFPSIKDFVFLQAHKDNTLTVSAKQNLDGSGVIELAKHGSLYIVEKTVSVTKPSTAFTSTVSVPASSIACTSASHDVNLPPDGLSESRKLLIERADRMLEKLKVTTLRY